MLRNHPGKGTKTKLIIFDIDGTLSDTVSVHQHCLQNALSALDIEPDNKRWGTYRHHTDAWILRCSHFFRRGRPVDSEFEKRFSDELLDRLKQQCETDPVREITGARRFINFLLEQTEYAIVYATGAYRNAAEFKLGSLGIPYSSDIVMSSEHCVSREELIEKSICAARSYFGTNEFETVTAFGDGPWDLATAVNMRLGFVGITTPEKHDTLKKLGARHIFRDYSNIREIQRAVESSQHYA